MTHAAELRTAAGRTPDTALAALLTVLAEAADHPAAATTGLLATVLHPALAVARGIRDTTQETRMPDTTPTTELRRTLDRVADLHELDGGACGTCADADGQAAVWPCETAQQLQVAEQLLRAVEQPAPARLVLGTTDQQPTTAPDDRRARYAAAMALRDGHPEWPVQYEDDERDYLRRADAVLAVADEELAAALPEFELRGDTEIRAAALLEAADYVGNDDTCDCGGCDSCVPNKLAAGLRRMADEAQQPTKCENCGHAPHGHAEHLSNPQELTDCPNCPCATELREMDGEADMVDEAQPATDQPTEARCDVTFIGGGQCEKDADHRDGRWSDDPHTPKGHGRPAADQPDTETEAAR